MRISDWSSDVCSSDLFGLAAALGVIIDDMRNHWCVIARDDILHQPALHDDGDLRHVIDSGRRRRGGDRDTGERRGPCGEHCLIEIGRAHVWTPVTNAHLVCRLLLENTNANMMHTSIVSSRII